METNKTFALCPKCNGILVSNDEFADGNLRGDSPIYPCLPKYEGDDNDVCEVWCPHCNKKIEIYAKISTIVEVSNPLKEIKLDCSYCKFYKIVKENNTFLCKGRDSEYSISSNKTICNLFQLKENAQYKGDE